MKRGLFIILFLIISLGSAVHAQDIRCYYDGDSDSYGVWTDAPQIFPTSECGGNQDMICLDALGTGSEDCTMLGFDCDDSTPFLNERCSDIYCYKDEDQDNYVIHSDYYIITPQDDFFSPTRVCDFEHTDSENVASSQDDCDDDDSSIYDSCAKKNLFKIWIKRLF